MTPRNPFAAKLHQFIASALPVTTTEETGQEQQPSPAQRSPSASKAEPSNVEPLGKTIQEKLPRPPPKEPDLVSEIPTRTIVTMPKGTIGSRQSSGNHQHPQETDWELLSERGSFCSATAESVFVARAGSVRSIASMEHESSSNTTRSVPYKIQRTNSSSTIDSQDHTLGPSGKGVLGVDYVEHIVLPTDTLQGICIAYKVSASSLRRANHFTGHSLHSAPKKLLIPLSKQALRTGYIRVQDTDSKEYKLHYFQAEHPDLGMTEAKVYLELADWNLKHALQSAKEDKEWEKEVSGVSDTDELREGEISIKVDRQSGRTIGFRMKGKSQSPASSPKRTGEGSNDTTTINSSSVGVNKKATIVHSKLPAIATKSALAEDVYRAALEDQSFGVELKPIQRRLETTRQ